MPSTEISISLENLTKAFGPVRALDHVNMTFSPGIMHGIIGPEGAGKTTLMRTLLGLLKPQKGQIRYQINGKPQKFDSIRAKFAYMPQQQSLYPDLSIDEHLQFFRSLYQIEESRYLQKRNELLQITRLEPFVARAAGQLSGGMYKKLGLMCALLRFPDVILLDEPTNGVDPISRREFWDLLYRLQDQKILILVATAYMDEAERCAEVHLMESGRVVAEGEPRELLRKEKVESFDQLFLKHSNLGGNE
jgi:ABC-2 type transport system ATP-binding protein